jgi:hypothetical protein
MKKNKQTKQKVRRAAGLVDSGKLASASKRKNMKYGGGSSKGNFQTISTIFDEIPHDKNKKH